MLNREDPKILFGLCLKEFRQKAGLSQEALADIVGLDRTYISSCERGKRNISLLNIYKFAEALNISPSQLLKKGK